MNIFGVPSKITGYQEELVTSIWKNDGYSDLLDDDKERYTKRKRKAILVTGRTGP
jgi:hypothetical protein